MPKQPSELALQVMRDYDKVNPVGDQEECVEPDRKRKGFDNSIIKIGREENITPRAVSKCIKKATGRIAMRLYILTEIERLHKLFDGEISDEDIDEIISDNLSNLIKSGEFGSRLREVVL